MLAKLQGGGLNPQAGLPIPDLRRNSSHAEEGQVLEPHVSKPGHSIWRLLVNTCEETL